MGRPREEAQKCAPYYQVMFQGCREAMVDGKEQQLELCDREVHATSQAMILRSEEKLPVFCRLSEGFSMLLRNVFPLPVGAAACTAWEKLLGRGGDGDSSGDGTYGILP